MEHFFSTHDAEPDEAEKQRQANYDDVYDHLAIARGLAAENDDEELRDSLNDAIQTLYENAGWIVPRE